MYIYLFLDMLIDSKEETRGNHIVGVKLYSFQTTNVYKTLMYETRKFDFWQRAQILLVPSINYTSRQLY